MADDPRHLYSEPHGDPGHSDALVGAFDSGSHGRGLDGHESVGGLLCRTRESLGYDLRFVADSLRIRYVYLEAIEGGRHAELPGPAYAIGFVRSYAEFLGLRDDEVVRRFKEEVHGIGGQHLHFPEPVNEAKVPGKAILLVSLVLIAAAYGGWHVLSGQDRTFADFVPAVPDRLMAMIDGSSTDSGEEPASSVAADDAAAPSQPAREPVARDTAQPAAVEDAMQASSLVDSAVPSEVASDSPVESLDGAEPAEDAVAGDADIEVTAPEGDAAASDIREIPTPPETAPDPEIEVETLEAAGETEAAAADSAAAAPDPAGDAPPAEPQAQDTAIPPAPPQEQSAALEAERVFGADNGGSRIMLRATQDSWVQVRGADNSLLLTRVLNPGDVYRVPDRAGLVLHTGNAGGLEVVVDGNATGTLGDAGEVRRNIQLEPATFGG